jgi:hypothetical protein
MMDNVQKVNILLLDLNNLIVITKVYKSQISSKLKKLNSMVWVRERTIPTERPPLVGEAIANLCG